MTHGFSALDITTHGITEASTTPGRGAGGRRGVGRGAGGLPGAGVLPGAGARRGARRGAGHPAITVPLPPARSHPMEAIMQAHTAAQPLLRADAILARVDRLVARARRPLPDPTGT